MNAQAQLYYARKFFPHLREAYALLCVQAILRARGMLLLLLLALPLLAGAADFTGPNKTTSSTVLTNMLVASVSGAKAYDVTVSNTSGSDVWVLVFDSATNKVNGALSSLNVLVPAGRTGGFNWPTGRPFRNGITVAGSTTMPALTNTSTILTVDVTWLDRMF